MSEPSFIKIRGPKHGAIEDVLKEQNIKNKMLSWLRVDVTENEPLAYVCVFERGRVLFLRFQKDPIASIPVRVVPERMCVQTFHLDMRANELHLKRELRTLISKAYVGWRAEEKQIERLQQIINKASRNQSHFPLHSIRCASVHDDFHNGIDAWINFAGQGIPLQIKTSDEQVAKHKERYPAVPVMKCEQASHEEDLLSELLVICKEYLKKHGTRKEV